MKRYLKNFLLLLITLLSLSCQEDEAKIIQVDLSIESNQLFRVSTVWGESLYFGLLGFGNFSLVSSEELPGCPDVLVESQLNRVTLTFDPSTDCNQSGKVKRVGKVVLQYSLLSNLTTKWTMTYQDYMFENDTIKGTREFSVINSNQVKESFTELKTTSNKRVSYTFSGSLNHSLSKLRLKLIGISSSGIISGINPAGRLFTTELSSPREALVTCYTQNEILPVSGKETWTVSRGQNRDVVHTIDYETSGTCDVTATVKLSDGRNLIVSI
jgi:hypothetical protein